MIVPTTTISIILLLVMIAFSSHSADNTINHRTYVCLHCYVYMNQEVAELEERAKEGYPDAQFRTHRRVGVGQDI